MKALLNTITILKVCIICITVAILLSWVLWIAYGFKFMLMIDVLLLTMRAALKYLWVFFVIETNNRIIKEKQQLDHDITLFNKWVLQP